MTLPLLDSVISTSFRSNDQFQKSFGSVTFDQATLAKAGTLLVGYGSQQISFSTVVDYLIFVNQIIIPMTNKILSESLETTAPSQPMVSGVAGTDPIHD